MLLLCVMFFLACDSGLRSPGCLALPGDVALSLVGLDLSSAASCAWCFRLVLSGLVVMSAVGVPRLLLAGGSLSMGHNTEVLVGASAGTSCCLGGPRGAL